MRYQNEYITLTQHLTVVLCQSNSEFTYPHAGLSLHVLINWQKLASKSLQLLYQIFLAFLPLFNSKSHKNRN